MPSLRAWRDDLPKPVERYLVHLLAKNPVGRPLSAQDAASSLASLARQYYPGEESEHEEPAPHDPEEAVSKAREYTMPYPPSSPSIALFKDGKVVHFVERHMIEGQSAQMIAKNLIGAFETYCN